MVFTIEGLFEVAIESWPEWDLNTRPLNSVQTLVCKVIKLKTFVNSCFFIYQILRNFIVLLFIDQIL